MYDFFFFELQFLFCCLILYVNVRSIKDDEVIDMCVGALIIYFKPNFAVKCLIYFLCDWICHDDANFLILHLNLQLTQLGIEELIILTQSFQV